MAFSCNNNVINVRHSYVSWVAPWTSGRRGQQDHFAAAGWEPASFEIWIRIFAWLWGPGQPI